LTPNTYRRNLFPVNAGQKNTKIPILTNNNDRDFSKTDAGPQRTVNIIKSNILFCEKVLVKIIILLFER